MIVKDTILGKKSQVMFYNDPCDADDNVLSRPIRIGAWAFIHASYTFSFMPFRLKT